VAARSAEGEGAISNAGILTVTPGPSVEPNARRCIFGTPEKMSVASRPRLFRRELLGLMWRFRNDRSQGIEKLGIEATLSSLRRLSARFW
jgi:hypothetical protein